MWPKRAIWKHEYANIGFLDDVLDRTVFVAPLQYGYVDCKQCEDLRLYCISRRPPTYVEHAHGCQRLQRLALCSMATSSGLPTRRIMRTAIEHGIRGVNYIVNMVDTIVRSECHVSLRYDNLLLSKRSAHRSSLRQPYKVSTYLAVLFRVTWLLLVRHSVGRIDDVERTYHRSGGLYGLRDCVCNVVQGALSDRG